MVDETVNPSHGKPKDSRTVHLSWIGTSSLRLADLLVSEGIITKEQLQECLNLIGEEHGAGTKVTLEEALILRGYVTSQQIRERKIRNSKGRFYCGQCGQETTNFESDRSRKCASCSLMFYPRLSPSIIVCVNKGEEILLARNKRARGNFYSTIAGFVEPGESIEETVHREVFEEVGIRVHKLKYFGSQSWPFPNSLMLGFHAEYDSGEFVLQEDEIVDAGWFHYTDLPNRPAMVSISGWLINDFIKRAEVNQIQTQE